MYIYPKAGGDVTAVNVKAGDVVAAGQVLLEIDTKQVDTSKNSMDAAKVAWDDAQSTLARMAPLLIKRLRDIRLPLRLRGFSMSPPRSHMKTRWNSAM